MLAAARVAARPARFPGTQAASTNTAGGTSSRTRDESNRASTSKLFHVLPLFLCVFPIYDTLSSRGCIIRQATVEGQNGALNRPHYVSPGEVSGIGTAGATIPAHHSPRQRPRRGGLAALRVLQSNLYPGHSNPADVSPKAHETTLCISSSTLDRIRPVATAAGILMGGGEQGGGRPPRPRSHAASPSKGPFYGKKSAAGVSYTNRA